jgi:RNA polymerase sigma factor (sigma-70 family)
MDESASNQVTPDTSVCRGTATSASSADVDAAVAAAHRSEWAFVLAATVRIIRDIDLAEECAQDAYAQALATWTEHGIPSKPGAWLTTVARRRALDLLRRKDTARRALPMLVTDAIVGAEPAIHHEIPDDRLRLIFTCCHPGLTPQAQAALSLRLLCGLSTAEVASAFLVSEPTMAARITRAKKTIAAARIPYRVPPLAELPQRIAAVLTVVRLIFTTGHTAPAGDQLTRTDLVKRALDLARMLHALLPDDVDVSGLLALILLTDARRAARTDDHGDLQLLADQDRGLWDRAAITEGLELVRQSLSLGRPSEWSLMAAIAAVHAESPTWEQTDWAELVGLYDLLIQHWPSPVVALNRAVAVSFAHGPQAGLDAVDTLSGNPELATYGYLAAARADFLRRLGRIGEARTAYAEALILTSNAVERRFLESRLDELGSDGATDAAGPRNQ